MFLQYKEKTESITGKPEKLIKGDCVVAEVIGRNGCVTDRIYKL